MRSDFHEFLSCRILQDGGQRAHHQPQDSLGRKAGGSQDFQQSCKYLWQCPRSNISFLSLCVYLLGLRVNGCNIIFCSVFSVSQIVVDFTATWCGPCRLMAPIFTELSKKYDQLIFLKVDVDEVQVIDPLHKRFGEMCTIYSKLPHF